MITIQLRCFLKRYFNGSLLQLEQLRSEEGASDSQRQADLKIAVAPLLDLIDISGYCIFTF